MAREMPMEVPVDWKTRGMRLTPQRQLILEVIRESHIHPTADQVFDLVRKRAPRISLGTVYRNLKVLKELNLIRERKFTDGVSRYDRDLEPHFHLVCLKCGQIEDARPRGNVGIDALVEDVQGFQVVEHQLEIRGICPACRTDSTE